MAIQSSCLARERILPSLFDGSAKGLKHGKVLSIFVEDGTGNKFNFLRGEINWNRVDDD